MKRILTDYFQFTKRERRALWVLLLFTAACFAAPYFIPEKKLPQIFPHPPATSVKKDNGASKSEALVASETAIKKHLFFFDPNTATVTDWQQLGVAEKLTGTILRYRAKGGKFRTAEDLKKIWGMSPQLAAELIPYVRLQGTAPSATNPKNHTLSAPSVPSVIDVNTADEKAWSQLPGMNNYLAAKMVRNRERLGGFYTLDQVRKTYGIPDSVYQLMLPWLRINPANMPKPDLNTASVWELQQKTGIAFPLAKAIVQYRNQYGAFAQVEDLRKLVLITDSIFRVLSVRVKVDKPL